MTAVAEEFAAPDTAVCLSRLLQFGDSMFPIGGFAFSGGLESAIQQGVVRDVPTLQAFARTVLDTIPNIQASWVTMGMKVGQTALHYGCNDFGSLMLEENVVSAANTTHRTSIEEMEQLIREAGFTPRKRRQDYRLLDESHATVAA